MSTTAPEYLTTLRDNVNGALQQWVDTSTTAWEQWSRAWTPVAEAGASALGLSLPTARSTQGGEGLATQHRHAHGCRDCGTSGCGDACDCCVPEADVVVRARAGEVRVVPFRLHNPWRREREVTLEVGPWHVCDGDGVEVRSRLEETSLTLKPCETRVVRLLVTAAGARQEGEQSQASDAKTPARGKVAPAAPAPAAEDVRASAFVTSRGGADVESCASAYADVRFEGCARPQRVAVVVLPGDCDPVDVGCDCGCCC